MEGQFWYLKRKIKSKEFLSCDINKGFHMGYERKDDFILMDDCHSFWSIPKKYINIAKSINYQKKD